MQYILAIEEIAAILLSGSEHILHFYMHNCNLALESSPTGIISEFSRSLSTVPEGQESLGDGVHDKISESHGLPALTFLFTVK